MPVELRQLSANDIHILRPELIRCLAGLAAHHNRVAQVYPGLYPLHDIEHTIDAMIKQLDKQKTRIAGLMVDGEMAGFCQASVSGKHGSLDYMYVDESQRGHGYGAMLMEWAMQVFEQARVRHVDLKVVLGNDAQAFYQRYGFKTRAVVMAKRFDR